MPNQIVKSTIGLDSLADALVGFIPHFILRESHKDFFMTGVQNLRKTGPKPQKMPGVPLRYSVSTMNDLPPNLPALHPLDPIVFTRQLCEIESTTYHEGAVGDFLEEFLAGRGWAVEKTPVEQPRENADGRPALEYLCGRGGRAA